MCCHKYYKCIFRLVFGVLFSTCQIKSQQFTFKHTWLQYIPTNHNALSPGFTGLSNDIYYNIAHYGLYSLKH